MNKNIKKDDSSYKDLIIFTFNLLIDIYGVDDAILLIYKINKLRGVKI